MDLAEEQKLPHKPFRDKLDWLLVCAIVCLIPMLCLFGNDLWFRTDYWFFPILAVAFLVAALWRGRLGRHAEMHRATASSTLLVSAGVVALGSASLLAPWLAVLSVVLLVIGWMLERLGGLPWPRVVAISAPLMVLLIFPLSDANDPLHGFTAAVAGSSSNLLDLLGVPQSLNQQFLELRNEKLDVSAVCRGVGNPYLLFTLTVLLCMVYGKSLSACLVTLSSVPLWSWAGAVLLVVAGAWVSENYEKSIFVGSRLVMVQSIVLLGCLSGILFFQWAILWLFSPFSAHSAGVGGLHKFYNSVVLWPERDPLRKRKARNAKDDQLVNREAFLMQRSVKFATLATLLLLLIAGSVCSFRLSRSNSSADLVGSSPSWQSVLRPTSNSAEIQRIVDPKILGEEMFGMRLVGFESFRTPGTACSLSSSTRWIYSAQSRQIQITATIPYRGFYPVERLILSEGGQQLLSPRTSFTVDTAPDVVFVETTFRDTLLGPDESEKNSLRQLLVATVQRLRDAAAGEPESKAGTE